MAVPRAASIPKLIYGTAWKKDQTRALVRSALQAGFRAIDTAAQPKHYQEDQVGLGIADFLRDTPAVKRRDLYVQTKFTSAPGHDPARMPFDAHAGITEQVRASVEGSLRNLRHVDEREGGEGAYVDCLLLHSPYPNLPQTEEAWRAMEEQVSAGVRTLGISNLYYLPALEVLWDLAVVKPSVLQNRFYADMKYDVEIRDWCQERGVRYQSFWTLTANPRLVGSEVVGLVASQVGVSRQVALYGLVVGLGNVSVLDGTTKAERMVEDLEGVEMVERWRVAQPNLWRESERQFRGLLESA